jgi:hypothetical protein
VFENRVLRIFGPKRVEVTEGCTTLHNGELHNLHSYPSIINIMKSKRMRWTGYVAFIRKTGMHIGYWWEKQKDRDHSEDQNVGGWTMLKWILER